jgi:hypothetical protein
VFGKKSEMKKGTRNWTKKENIIFSYIYIFVGGGA